MAKSARELFDEAMKLDPEERATLMRLLIESMDAESEDGVEDANDAQPETEHSHEGCTGQEASQVANSQ